MRKVDMVFTAACRICNKYQDIYLSERDYREWKGGKLIQTALPYLTVDERELLISKTCGECWEKMFTSEGDTNDED